MKAPSRVGLVVMAAMAAVAHAQPLPEDLERIVREGRDRSRAPQTLTELCTKIGARLAGSPQYANAERWAVRKFRSWGLKNVRLEPAIEIPVGWERGKRQMVRMTRPTKRAMTFTTYAWTNGTKGKVKGEVVAAPTTMDALNASLGDLKGKWVLLPPTARRGEPPSVPADVVKALSEAPILGVIRGGPNDRPMTHGSWIDKTYDKRPSGVTVLVGKSDAEALQNAISAGQKPEVEADIEVKWHKGPVTNHNVVAEIPGTEKPDEVVIVSAHLDSWNGPGSQGCSDNGTGVTSTMEAARVLAASGLKPKRTIRFILWAAEEQGLHGSRAYVQKHMAEMPKISAVFVDDAGANYVGGYAVLQSQAPYFQPALDVLNKGFPALPVKLDIVPRMPRGGASDHAPFNGVGTPGFFSFETGDFSYGDIYHNNFDRVSAVLPKFRPYVVQSGTAQAVFAYTLAQAESLLPRQPADAPASGAGG